MMALLCLSALKRMADCADIINGFCAFCLQHGDKFIHNALNHHSVVAGTVMIELRKAEMVGNHIKLMAFQFRQQRTGHWNRIQHHRCIPDGVP